MPWYEYNPESNSDALGKQVTDATLNCECTQKSKGASLYCTVEASHTIYINVDAHSGSEATIEGTYGHEQRHVRAFNRHFETLTRRINAQKGDWDEGIEWVYSCCDECMDDKEEVEDLVTDAVDNADFTQILHSQVGNHGIPVPATPRASIAYDPIGDMPDNPAGSIEGDAPVSDISVSNKSGDCDDST